MRSVGDAEGVRFKLKTDAFIHFEFAAQAHVQIEKAWATDDAASGSAKGSRCGHLRESGWVEV